MKLILPIAGVGTRLRPFTFSKPKAFVKAAGKRVVDHMFQKLKPSLSGRNHIPLIAITGYRERQIKDYFHEHFSDDYDITYQLQEPKNYEGDVPIFGGLGEAIYITKDWFSSVKSETGDEENNETLILLGDMIPLKDYDNVFNALKDPDVDAVIGTMIVPDEKTKYYGIVETDEDNNIRSMVEKPKKTNSNQAIAGVYAFKDFTLNRLYKILEDFYNKHIKSGKRKEFQFTPSLQKLVEEGFKIKSSVFEEGILDFGHHDALLRGNRALLDNMEPDLENKNIGIHASHIEKTCIIGKDTKIKRSIIGPYVSIGDNCKIKNCSLQDVVIGDNTSMTNIITKNSIIGDNVKIDAVIKDNMIIGDDSYIIEEQNGIF